MVALLQPSLLDTKRFSRRVYRAKVGSVAEAEALLAAVQVQRAEGAEPVELLIVRAPIDALEAVQRLEREGYFLTDTLVYYRAPAAAFAGVVPAPIKDTVLRELAADDRRELSLVAREAFTHFRGHYHTDPRLDRAAATEAYVEWAVQASTNPSFLVLLSVTAGKVSGFVTVERQPEQRWEIVLNGIAPENQGQGLYDALVKEVGARALAFGAKELLASTQLSNLPPQKVWTRNHFEPSHGFYTLHGWHA